MEENKITFDGVCQNEGEDILRGGIYFSGGINDRSEKGFYDPRIFYFREWVKCPICKNKFDPSRLRIRVDKAEYDDGTTKNVVYCMCPWGHEVNAGTDIRNYQYIDYGYME